MKSVGTLIEHRPLNPRTKEDETVLDPRNPRKTQLSTERMADYLVSKFNSPEHRPFFYKAAWRIDEATLSRIVAASFERNPASPRAYFIKSVKNEPSYGRARCI